MSDYFEASRRARALLAGIVCLALYSPGLLPSTLASDGDIAMVVGPDSPVSELTLSQTRKLLLGEQQFWNSNLRVTLLLRPPAAREREVVLKVIYRMNEAEFRQYWISKMFRAEAVSGPKIVSSNGMAAELLNALPGSVAFIEASQVPKGLKILKSTENYLDKQVIR